MNIEEAVNTLDNVIENLQQVRRITVLQERIELLNDVRKAADRLRGALEDGSRLRPIGDALIREALENLTEALKICEIPNGI